MRSVVLDPAHSHQGAVDECKGGGWRKRVSGCVIRPAYRLRYHELVLDRFTPDHHDHVWTDPESGVRGSDTI